MTKFTIIKDYLKSVNFTSPFTPQIFFDNDENKSTLEVCIDTKYTAEDEDILYDVTVRAVLSPKTQTKEVFHLEIEYASVVYLNLPEDADDEEKRRVLMLDVPQTLYPIVRDVVAQLTFRSGFPPVQLQYYDFERRYLSKYGNGEIDTSLENCGLETFDESFETFSYEKIVPELSDTKEGAEFIQTCVSYGMNPNLTFEQTPMYKYLLRYVSVPEFNFPLIDEAVVDFSFFEMLYRMLVFSDSVRYRFAVDEVLELYVTYGGINDKPISKMSFDELKSLAKSLIIESWVNYNVLLSRLFTAERQTKADEYIEDLGINTMISQEDYLAIFENFADNSILDLEQVKTWQRKLQEIDLSTIKYRY